MARILICTMPITGHVNPAYPIARELVARGNEVVWYGGAKFRRKIEATGARFAPMVAAYDFDDSDYDAAFPGRRNLKGMAKLKFDLINIFVEPSAGQTADIEVILKDFPADVIVCDSGFGGAPTVSERGGPIFANYCVSNLAIASRDLAPNGLGMLPNYTVFGRMRNSLFRSLAIRLFRDVNDAAQRVRLSLGLPRNTKPIFDQTTSPYLYIQGGTEGFEYPRNDLPAFAHFVGSLLPPPPTSFVPPSWWNDVLTCTSVVLVTQGTVATDSTELIQPTLRALANEDVLVVATADSQKLDFVPTNARVTPFVPFTELMPHVSVMITNGGWGGVQTALSYGVPVIGAGTTEDKPEVNNRIAWSGVGLNLKTATPTPPQIYKAVKQVITDDRYRKAARRIQAEIATHNPPSEAADLIERLAATQKPVTRGTSAIAAIV